MAALSQLMSFGIIGWLGFEGEPPITIFDGEVGRPGAATRLVTASEKVDVDCVFQRTRCRTRDSSGPLGRRNRRQFQKISYCAKLIVAPITKTKHCPDITVSHSQESHCVRPGVT